MNLFHRRPKSVEEAPKLLIWYFYLRMCYNQTWDYVQIPVDLFEKFLLVSIYLKVFGLAKGWLVMVFLVGVVINVTIGHFLIKHQFNAFQQSFNNRYNPEIMKIYHRRK